MVRYKMFRSSSSSSVKKTESRRLKPKRSDCRTGARLKAKTKMSKGGSQTSARIIWGNEQSGILLPTSPSKFVRDKTWIMHYEHQALNFTDVTVKAGNKAMALTGLSDEDLKLRTSESLLVRKYRYSPRPHSLKNPFALGLVHVSQFFFFFPPHFLAIYTRSAITSSC